MSDIGNGRAGRVDVVIVGGGAAGAVLANRLSEDPTRSILLEARSAAPHRRRTGPVSSASSRPAHNRSAGCRSPANYSAIGHASRLSPPRRPQTRPSGPVRRLCRATAARHPGVARPNRIRARRPRARRRVGDDQRRPQLSGRQPLRPDLRRTAAPRRGRVRPPDRVPRSDRHTLGLPDTILDYPVDTSRAIAKLHYSNTFARTPDIKYVFVHAGGTIPYLASRFAIVDEMDVIPGARERGAFADVLPRLYSGAYVISRTQRNWTTVSVVASSAGRQLG